MKDGKDKDDVLRLDQCLKFNGMVQSGGEAKHLIQGGGVKVSGQVETRRGRKLIAGDVVEASGMKLVVD